MAPAMDVAWKMNLSFLAEFPGIPGTYQVPAARETFAEQVMNFYGRGRNRAF